MCGTQIDHFDHAFHIGKADIAIFIGSGVSRIEPASEFGLVDADLVNLDGLGAQRAIKLAAETDRLATIGLFAGLGGQTV